ncbi:two-component system response regulator [Niastella yeongjuensis]|uniref:Two-component system response regulator n=1 Tax=Niastella yeongjuensis TaxID=354355 RepID=A0A1V9E3Q4_9BACT|nr:response regulator transcription factor [Niastella yeongjuensis]OQP40719.1 two-component system response regulator [Niastella yeongjuensis]SEP03731.1 DNA-binding response regulator, OmpR family, contains REC and winged-helix (wHTH) domain [Niastella yeongjuensis]
MNAKILLVEDEIDLGNVVKQYLEIVGFEVDWAKNGKLAFDQLQQFHSSYQLAIIDVSMPVMDGFELANRIFEAGIQIPFIFLTARNEKADRLYGLKIGADDYISKPFDVDELVLRIKNIIRRYAATETPQRPIITRGDVEFNKDSLRLSIKHRNDIILTPREAELLLYLFEHENKILRRENILVQLWGKNDYFLGRSLDVFISRLRKHLNNSNCIRIENVYGVGFIFRVQE